MAKLPRVDCKVQRGSPESRVVRKDIPENLANGDDAIWGNVM
jgi:hypothetical protein